MTKIHRKVEYALIAIKHISQESAGRVVSSAEISQTYSAPAELMARVLQILAKSGYLKSVAGASGGYLLARPLEQVSFFELLQSLEGPVEIARCLQSEEGSECEIFSSCNIVSPVQQLNHRLTEFYKNLSLSELLNSPVATGGIPSASAIGDSQHATEVVNHG
jgi:Rrf2 family protein